MTDHHLILFLLAADMTFDDISKLSIGVLAIFMLFRLLQPLIASLIENQKGFATTMAEFSTTMTTLVGTIAEMRADLRGHTESDGETNAKLIGGAGCKFDPDKHRRTLP